jgi:tryptophan synthase beta chain
MAARCFGLETRIFMVQISYDQKPYRKTSMNLMGSEVLASPTNLTRAGREARAKDPDNLGNLGLAISEAVEEASERDDTNYALGSVLNHVLLHQTVIGQETKKQLALAGEKPDYLIACHGGGSNFGGLVAPFVPELLSGLGPKVIAAEPVSCPTLTKGRFGYDFGDVAGLTPLVPMFSLGVDFQPPAIHAGGLRYHGSSPIVSALLKEKLISAQAIEPDTAFHYARVFAQSEAIIPAPESGHAVAAACLKALELEKDNDPRTIVFCLSGHGLFDLAAYENF